MKNYLALAICCFAIIFSSCNKTDDPNNPNNNGNDPIVANFVGNYSGKLATVTKISFPWNTETDLNTLDFTMNLTPSSESNKVNAHCTAYGQTFNTVGTITNDRVKFEPSSVSVSASSILHLDSLNIGDYNISQFLNANVDLTFDFSGQMKHDAILNVDYLYLDGTTYGALTPTVIIPVTFPINGTAIGRVNKIQ